MLLASSALLRARAPNARLKSKNVCEKKEANGVRFIERKSVNSLHLTHMAMTVPYACVQLPITIASLYYFLNWMNREVETPLENTGVTAAKNSLHVRSGTRGLVARNRFCRFGAVITVNWSHFRAVIFTVTRDFNQLNPWKESN